MSRKALLLVGSPRDKRSTSYSVGSYLMDKLKGEEGGEEEGFETGYAHIQASLKEREGKEGLLASIDEADVLILAFPLYVDSLPAAVIRLMEIMGARKRAKEQTLAAIVNCGFPETSHNDTAVAIVREFARQAGFNWAGAIAFGQGGVVAARPLNEHGGPTQVISKALALAAQALRESRQIPEEARELLRKPFIPKTLYVRVGDIGWKLEARKNKAQKKLYDKPYQRKDN